MNLYIFNESRAWVVRGVETYLSELTAALKNSDINICVVHANANIPQIETVETDGIRHWYLPGPLPQQRSLNPKRQWDLYHRSIVYLLKWHIKDKKNLVFHLNYHRTATLAVELKKAFDCQIVMPIHYIDLYFNRLRELSIFRQMEENRQDRNYMQLMETYQSDKELYDRVDRIICLSENTRQVLKHNYKIEYHKTTVIYNGLTDVKQIADQQSLKQKYRIPDIPVFLFAGRVEGDKGLLCALRAFKRTINTQPACHLIIAGSGQFEFFMKECEDIWMHVTWTGVIGKEKLYDLYALADVGLLPSFNEQCSYAAIEMMMHGLPMIGSTSSGLKEMIVDGETGLHLPVIDHEYSMEIDDELFAEKMVYLLQNPDERKRMGANARRRYETLYSSEIFRNNMLDFYDGLSTTQYDNALKTAPAYTVGQVGY